MIILAQIAILLKSWFHAKIIYSNLYFVKWKNLRGVAEFCVPLKRKQLATVGLWKQDLLG